MFGSTVLVPILFGVNPATILLMNGIGTLLYLFITKGKIPAYLGSSFAFISPVIVVLDKFNGPDGYSYVLGGFLAVGIDRKSTRLNSSHVAISYAVFCLKKKSDVQMSI